MARAWKWLQDAWDSRVSWRRLLVGGALHSAPVLSIRALGKWYRAGVAGCWAHARTLVGVDLDVQRGEVVALVGAAGAGKTTLLHCAALLLAPDQGFVEHAARADGSASTVRYFADCTEAGRAVARTEWWDVALIDNIDRVCGDVAAAFALVRVLARARSCGTSLLLAAREVSVVRELCDRVLVLKHGRLTDQGGVARPSIARVAEHVTPLTVIPAAPSIR